MYIVRKQDANPKGGAAYLIEASKSYDMKYRWEKTAKRKAVTFGTKRTARTWAERLGGEVVEMVG